MHCCFLQLKDSPQPSEDKLPELKELRAEAKEKLKQVIIESPASNAFLTVSQRLVLFTCEFKDLVPHYYTAPSSPVPIDPILAPEKPISESTTPIDPTLALEQPISEPTTPKEKSSSKSPESQYITAASSEETRPTRVQEPVTKSRKKRSSKSTSPKPDTPSSKVWHVTPPSSPPSPTVLKSKVLSESPQIPKVKATMKPKRTPSPRFGTTPGSSCDSPPLPTNERGRREYLLKAYKTRNTYQVGFLAAAFELNNGVAYKKGLRDLIKKQRWFEKEWPSPEYQPEASDKTKVDIEDSISGTAIEKREFEMLDDVCSGQAFLESVWEMFDVLID